MVVVGGERLLGIEAAGVAGVIDDWRPQGVSAAAGVFAREVVSAAAPGSRARARALLFAACRLAAFAEGVGLELQQALVCEAMIERFVAEGCPTVSSATRRTLRTNLRSLARSLERYPPPVPLALARERAKAPYTVAEIDGYLRLARALSSEQRRVRASALICLGAGAGIIAGELRGVRGSDIVERAGGMLVVLAGPRARSVPVLARYQQPLRHAAAFAGERLIIGGREPARRNITDALSHALSADASLARLQAGRLRSSWLVACASQIGLAAFMQAAGIACSQRLGDLVAQLPASEETELVALLGGQRRAQIVS